MEGNHPAGSAGSSIPTTTRKAGSGLWGIVLLLITLGAPFIGAGTLAWPMGCLYIGLTLGASVLSRIAMLRAHPELAAERSAFVSKPGTKDWERILVPLVLAGPTAVALVAGLNYRFGWSPAVAPVIQTLAVAVLFPAFGLAGWAMASNPFFSSVVRIQAERGHHAISFGPYRFVRHPSYAASIPAQLCFALMLGSAWALIPATITSAIIVLRTALEDRALQAELPGYPEYAAQVHYRLLPGVW